MVVVGRWLLAQDGGGVSTPASRLDDHLLLLGMVALQDLQYLCTLPIPSRRNRPGKPARIRIPLTAPPSRSDNPRMPNHQRNLSFHFPSQAWLALCFSRAPIILHFQSIHRRNPRLSHDSTSLHDAILDPLDLR